MSSEAKEKKSMSLRLTKALRGAAASAERAANSAFTSTSKETIDSPERGGSSSQGQNSNSGSAHGAAAGSNRSSGSFPVPLSFDTSSVSNRTSTNPFDEPAQAEEEKRELRQSDDEKNELTTVFGSVSDKSLESGDTPHTNLSVGRGGGSAKFPSMKDNLSQEKVLSELGVGRSASWRIPIFGDFEQLQSGGRVSEREFLAFMQRRGHEPLWCQAAYNSFIASNEEEQGLDQFQYLLAVSALTFNRGSSDSGDNVRWISIRQLLVYNLFLLRDQHSQPEQGQEGSGERRAALSSTSGVPVSGETPIPVGHCLSSAGFIEFLKELSSSDESPHFYGINNADWCPSRVVEMGIDAGGGLPSNSGGVVGAGGGSHRHQRTSLELMDQSTMAESLAISKVQLASKQSEYEALELQYLKLEKQLCRLKLELADEKAKRDTV